MPSQTCWTCLRAGEAHHSHCSVDGARGDDSATAIPPRPADSRAAEITSVPMTASSTVVAIDPRPRKSRRDGGMPLRHGNDVQRRSPRRVCRGMPALGNEAEAHERSPEITILGSSLTHRFSYRLALSEKATSRRGRSARGVRRPTRRAEPARRPSPGAIGWDTHTTARRTRGEPSLATDGVPWQKPDRSGAKRDPWDAELARSAARTAKDCPVATTDLARLRPADQPAARPRHAACFRASNSDPDGLLLPTSDRPVSLVFLGWSRIALVNLEV